MSKTKATIKEILQSISTDLTPVRENKFGFKRNISSLNNHSIKALDSIGRNNDVDVKRSGTGLVVIVTI